MPSYYRGYTPYYHNYRQVILTRLRQKQQRLKKLEDFLYSISSRVLPRKRRQPYSPGLTQTKFHLEKPRLSKKHFHQLLYTLKRDDLIDISTEGNTSTLSITKKGIDWLKGFQKKPHLVSTSYNVNLKKTNNVIVISYDVPEKIHWYRDWLREALKNLELKMVHRSVWIGKIKLPVEFIADLTRYRLDRYVEIFEITKAGTLRHRL